MGVRSFLALLSLALSSSGFAGEPVQGRPKVAQGNNPEPVISIRDTADSRIKEWRQNGRVVAIRVEPRNGFPAYYLVDTNGDGLFEPGPDFGDEGLVVQWVLFRF